MLALAIMVTFGLTYSRAGPYAAWFAGLALLLFPRFAFHGRVPTLDMTVAATTKRFLTVLLAPAPETGLAGARHHGAGLWLGVGE